jgi:hypothetical protein
MSDIAKLLGRFFARDFLYLVGGTNILLAILIARYGFEEGFAKASAFAAAPAPLLIIGAGLTYVLGYFINYVFGLFKLNTPADRLVPWDPCYPLRGDIIGIIFKRLNGYDIENFLDFIDKRPDIRNLQRKDIRAAHVYALEAISERHGYVERTFTIHHLSSVFGSTFVTSAPIFLVGSLCARSGSLFVASLAALLVGLIFCLDSHYRSAQIAIAHIMTSKWGYDHEDRTRDDTAAKVNRDRSA